MLDEWEKSEGAPFPLGIVWVDEEQAYNIAICCRHAEDMILLLYDSRNFTMPLRSIPLEFPRNKTNRIWHTRVSAELAGGACYNGYRITVLMNPPAVRDLMGRKSCSTRTRKAYSSLPAIAGPLPASRVRMLAGRPLASCRQGRPPRHARQAEYLDA